MNTDEKHGQPSSPRSGDNYAHFVDRLVRQAHHKNYCGRSMPFGVPTKSVGIDSAKRHGVVPRTLCEIGLLTI
jgi:hypothetical protein